MPVSNSEVVDGVNIHLDTGRVVLSMYEERPWENPLPMLQDLQRKINNYITFVISGQLTKKAEYANRPVEFVLCCEFFPAAECSQVFRGMADHLAGQQIAFRVFVGAQRSHELKI